MQIVIVGASAAGIAAAEKLRANNKDCSITVISEEEHLPYLRHKLMDYFLLKPPADFFIKPESFFKDNNINLILNKTAISLDTRKKRLKNDDDEYISFDKLLISTGSYFRLPDIKGANKENVLAIRSLKDINKIKDNLILFRSVFLAGDSDMIKEVALKLNKNGCEVFIVTKNRQKFSELAESEHLRFIENQEIIEIIGEGEVQAIKFSNGKVFACSLLLFFKEPEANLRLVKDSPLEIDRGIIVDEKMHTNIDDLYAAGDVARLKTEESVSFGWERARKQGEIAALTMLES